MLFAVGQHCNTPVANYISQQKFNQVATQYTKQQKWDVSSQFVSSSCVTSQQVRLMASLFTSDTYRLQFPQMVYHRTSDSRNYCDVYDAFGSFSAAFRSRYKEQLLDWIQTKKED
jgi:hypothetical protein